jgi:hypothetical protein
MIISLGYVLINNKYSYIKSQIVFKAEFRAMIYLRFVPIYYIHNVRDV